MQTLDKNAMGERVRQIRLSAGLRQWELAKLLGTTQSAVHKYEHGVVPEPRKLVELARIGGTSVEWVLTGHHWENGARGQQRVSPEVLNTAYLLREINKQSRERVDEALRIVRAAVRVVESTEHHAPVLKDGSLSTALRAHSAETLRLLESAWRIQRAVLSRVTRDAEQRLEDDPLQGGNGGSGKGPRGTSTPQ